MTSPRYPDCHIQLSGNDGNAFSILGRVKKSLKFYLMEEEGFSREGTAEILEQFQSEALSGDYDHLLHTCAEYVTIH